MNPVFIHTFDKSGALPVRLLFSAAGATLHRRTSVCAPVCTVRVLPLQFWSYCAVRALPLQFWSYCAVRALPLQFRNYCALRALPLQFESCLRSWRHLTCFTRPACSRADFTFAKEPYDSDDIQQKRPIIFRSLLIVATPYDIHLSTIDTTPVFYGTCSRFITHMHDHLSPSTCASRSTCVSRFSTQGCQ